MVHHGLCVFFLGSRVIASAFLLESWNRVCFGQKATVALGPTRGVPEPAGKRPDSALPGRGRRRNLGGRSVEWGVCLRMSKGMAFLSIFFRENRLVRMGPSLGQIWNLANLA